MLDKESIIIILFLIEIIYNKLAIILKEDK